MPISNPSSQQPQESQGGMTYVYGVGGATPVVSDTATVILPSNAFRIGVNIFNIGSNPVYLDLGYTPTINSFWIKLEPGCLYESTSSWNFLGYIEGIANESLSTTLSIREFVTQLKGH
jgi:hypothetical protein